jgi:hypothetical protein
MRRDATGTKFLRYCLENSLPGVRVSPVSSAEAERSAADFGGAGPADDCGALCALALNGRTTVNSTSRPCRTS